jgi:S-disulfanyl-L-cysteine oxidoreductase SoxD
MPAKAWRLALLIAGLCTSATLAQERLGIGHAATDQQIAGWNIDISPDGAGLPQGRGSVDDGKAIYAQKCAACHGAAGQGKPMDRLVGGQGTLGSNKPVKTVGSYWPYATTLFDFIRRAMPFNAPQSLQPDEVYALCAYLLALNKIIPDDSVLDASSLAKVEMPNRKAFVSSYNPPK